MDIVESMFVQLYERVKYVEDCQTDKKLRLELTSNEKMMLKLTFNAWVGGDPSSRGFEMFLGMFKTHPETQKLFEFARGSSAAQMQNSSRMLFHVTRVVKYIGLVVQNVDHLENVVPLLKELGGRHVQFGVPDNYFPWLGDSMRQLMATALTNWTDKHEQLWKKTFQWISDRLAEGEHAYGNV